MNSRARAASRFKITASWAGKTSMWRVGHANHSVCPVSEIEHTSRPYQRPIQYMDAFPASMINLPARFGTPLVPNLCNLLITKLVEAGGVEPPSEKARSEETTCVARFFLFGQYFRAGKRGTVPSPIDLESRLRTEVCSLSC